MAVEEPGKEEMAELESKVKEVADNITKEESEIEDTEELVKKVENWYGKSASKGKIKKGVVKALKDQKHEDKIIEEELEEEGKIEEEEGRLLTKYNELNEKMDEENEGREQALEGLADAIGEVKQNPSIEGFKSALGQSGQILEGLWKTTNEEMATAKGLDDLSELILETAEEEEEIAKEIIEEEKVAEESEGFLSSIGASKQEKMEEKLEKEDKKIEKKAVQEINEVEKLTEMDEEQIEVLQKELGRSLEEARELYGDLEDMERALNSESVRGDPLGQNSYGGADIEDMSESEKEKFEEEIQEEKKACKEARKKIKKAQNVLENAKSEAKKSEEVEREIEEGI